MNRSKLFAAAAALAVGFVLSAATTVAFSADKGPCTGPVSCPTSDCNNVGGGSAKCVGDGSLILYCANTNEECCETSNPECQIPWCFSDPDCTGIRVVPCNVDCQVSSSCGIVV